MAPATVVDIDGRELKLSNLDKVLYPEVGFTKGEVIDYYARVAPIMLPHLDGRCITFRRFPNGVDGTSFFEKRCPSHRPDWVDVAVGPGDRAGTVEYCLLDERASGGVGRQPGRPRAARADGAGRRLETPTMVVFDLDPGPPAGMTECAAVALDIHDALDGVGLALFPKTSGSKGLQLYLPLNTPHTHDQASEFALALAQLMEKHHPDRVVSNMKKELRSGKVLIDWSQNSRHKTTICAYSLRARPHPTVSTPVTWDEVEAAAGGEELSFEAKQVLERIDEHGDLFAETATLEQTLPRS